MSNYRTPLLVGFWVVSLFVFGLAVAARTVPGLGARDPQPSPTPRTVAAATPTQPEPALSPTTDPSGEEPGSIETSTPEPTATHTPEPNATRTPAPTATATHRPRPTHTATPDPTSTPRPTPTRTPTPEPTPTSKPTSTPVPTATSTPRPAPTATPDRSGVAETVRHLPTSEKVVALTFDAGADTGYTAQILDTLAAAGVRASFGMTGRWAEENPELMRRIVREGHAVINHTYSHRSLTGYSTGDRPLSYDERAVELWKTHKLVLDLTGASTKPYFRPPYGDYDDSVLRDVHSRGYEYNLMWSVDSLGWKGLTREQIVQRILDGLEPGAIYLFHVGSQSQDGPALPRIISELRERGYRFATIPDYLD